MSNLSRLSDVPNKPVNIVYLQSGNGPSAQPSANHSYSVTSSNGWSDGSRQPPHPISATPPMDYNTMPTPPPRDPYNTSTPSRSPYRQTQYRAPQGPPSYQNTHEQYDRRQSQHSRPDEEEPHSDEMDTDEIASLMATLRMKMEEKRERMEKKTSRMKAVASQKLGKAAYLKAINNNKVSGLGLITILSSRSILTYSSVTVCTHDIIAWK
jgi:hypothetical protein